MTEPGSDLALIWIRIEAISHPTEDPERVRDAIRRVARPLDEDVLAWSETRMETQHGAAAFLLAAQVSSKPRARALWRAWTSEPAVRAELAASAPDRLDDDLVVHLRYDKQLAATGARQLVRGGGDVVVAKAKLECHPARREVALAALERALAPAPATARPYP